MIHDIFQYWRSDNILITQWNQKKDSECYQSYYCHDHDHDLFNCTNSTETSVTFNYFYDHHYSYSGWLVRVPVRAVKCNSQLPIQKKEREKQNNSAMLVGCKALIFDIILSYMSMSEAELGQAKRSSRPSQGHLDYQGYVKAASPFF